MTHGSLFSGIGGFDLAAEWMGWQNVFHCEWNEFGQKVLKYYWPNAISYNDITKTDFTIHRGRIDILTGGFPCQPYSMAGKRLGKEDDRHLWPEMCRAIREIQPRWVVGENVLGLVNWSDGLVFHEVQADLEAEGYEVQPYVLPAVSVNAPHRRDRVWFVAKNTRSNGRLCGQSNKEGAEVREQRNISTRDTERVCGAEVARVASDTKCNGRGARVKCKHNNIREWTICSYKSKDGNEIRSKFRDGGSNWITPNTDGIGRDNGSDNRGERQLPCNEERDTEESESERCERFGQTGEICGDGYAAETNSDGLDRSDSEHEEQSGEGRKYAQRDVGESDDDGDAADTDNTRFKTFYNQESQLGKENRAKTFSGNGFKSVHPRNGWENFPTVSPICNGNDGISNRLDSITFSKWRQESIKAGGNAVVPQVVLQIFRTIEEYEKMNAQ